LTLLFFYYKLKLYLFLFNKYKAIPGILYKKLGINNIKDHILYVLQAVTALHVNIIGNTIDKYKINLINVFIYITKKITL
jgi:hypothetical protein